MSCPNCVEGSVLPGRPTGTISAEFHGAYFAPAPTGTLEKPSTRAIVFLSDGFGLPLKNCKIMADSLAQRLGCDVWVPDYFNGRPLVSLDNLILPDRAGVRMSAWDWIWFIASIIPSIPAFLASRPSVVDSRIHLFIQLLKEKKAYAKIGAVGYCYGGSTAIRLASTDLIQSVVICHPGSFTLAEAQAIRVPSSWACAEEDIFFAHSFRLQVENIFTARKDADTPVEYEFHDYKGTAHGFAARPNLNVPEVKEAYEKALDQAVYWFQRTLIT